MPTIEAGVAVDGGSTVDGTTLRSVERKHNPFHRHIRRTHLLGGICESTYESAKKTTGTVPEDHHRILSQETR